MIRSKVNLGLIFLNCKYINKKIAGQISGIMLGFSHFEVPYEMGNGREPLRTAASSKYVKDLHNGVNVFQSRFDFRQTCYPSILLVTGIHQYISRKTRSK